MTIEFPTTIQISFYKFTLTLFLQVLKFLSFNGMNYKSHAKVLCTFKLNSQCHDSLKMMAVIPRTDFIQGQFAFELKKFWFI